MAPAPTFRIKKKIVGTLPTLSTNVHAWRAHAWRMAPASERPSYVDATHIAPHKSINGAWPMADGRWPHRPAARLAGRPARWPHSCRPPAARLAGRWLRALRRWAPGQGRRPMATAAEGPQTKFFIAHIAHTTHKFIFGIFGTCLKAYLLHRARSKRLRRVCTASTKPPSWG